jgi:hypothetical protein
MILNGHLYISLPTAVEISERLEVQLISHRVSLEISPLGEFCGS